MLIVRFAAPVSVPSDCAKRSAVDVPSTLTVAPFTSTVPAPVMLTPDQVCVPPLNSTLAPDDAVNAPACVPPPLRVRFPASELTVPPLVLVNGTDTVDVPAPLDFLNVPLLTTEFVPEKLLSHLST